jgi:xylulokinase
MLLGIDVGTSSLKALLVDPAGAMAPALARGPVTMLTPAADRAEMVPEDIYAVLLGVLGQLRRDRPAEFAAVRAIGLSTIFPALVPLRADGSASGPAILYNDRRAQAQVDRLAASFGRERFEALTGNRLTPGTCTLPGILWLREHEPGRFREAHVFGQLSTFLLARLTGEMVVDTSHTSLSGMVRSGTEEQWDSALLACAGVDSSRLPRILPSAAVAGGLTTTAAAACGLRPGIPVVAGCGDAPLAALGGGVFEPGQLFASAGSTDCLMVSASRPSGDPTFCNVRSAVPGLWLAIGTMSSGGAAVRWLCDEVFRCTPEEMTRAAESAAPGSGGLCFLPYLQGERTPWWDSAARGAFAGLALTTGRPDLCRAVLEGIACGWRQIIELLEARTGVHAPELLCVGGGSANPLHNRIKASLLRRPVLALRFAETTSLGAALIAGLGAGVYPNLDAARDATHALRAHDRFEPVPEWQGPLDAVYGRYLPLYPALQPLFAG